MGWTRTANPKWARKARRQSKYPSEVMTHLNTDRFGTMKTDRWCVCWTGSRSQDRRYVNRIRRQASKRVITYELYEYQQWLDELNYIYEEIENWDQIYEDWLAEEAEYEAEVDYYDDWDDPHYYDAIYGYDDDF